MNNKQFKLAFQLASSGTDLSHIDDSILSGCCLPNFGTVCCTIEQVARTLRDHRYFTETAQFDMGEVNNIRTALRARAIIVN